MRALRIGTRGSRLALVQCALVARLLKSAGFEVELVTIATAGDLRPPDTAPGEGVFVTAIAEALAAGEIDIAVHSAKDLPVMSNDDLRVVAYPERADPRDALVARAGAWTAAGMSAGASAGTDSPRRTGFLLAQHPELSVRPLHGNVDTRLRRLDGGEVDILVLAAAGLDRLGLGARAAHRFDAQKMPPAPAQGALAVQARRDDRSTCEVLARIDAPQVRIAVEVEQAVLEGAGGGCRAPVGALAEVRGSSISLIAGAVDADGSQRRVIELELPTDAVAARRAALETGSRLRELKPAPTHEGGR